MSFTARCALAVLALTLTVPAAAVADCLYDFDFSYTAGGDVRVSVHATCGPGGVYQTHLSSSPGFNSVSAFGGFAQIVLDDEPGGQLYCASAVATYWNGPVLALDSGDSECATL